MGLSISTRINPRTINTQFLVMQIRQQLFRELVIAVGELVIAVGELVIAVGELDIAVGELVIAVVAVGDLANN